MNESAFPVSEESSRNKVAGVYGGMTLRDYFAAAALQGMLASGHKDAIEKATIAAGGTPAYGLAMASYGFADEMMAARDNAPMMDASKPVASSEISRLLVEAAETLQWASGAFKTVEESQRWKQHGAPLLSRISKFLRKG